MEFDLPTFSPWLDELHYDWSYLEKLGTEKLLGKDRMLFHFGDPVHHVFLVLKGRVRLFLTSSEGREKAIAIIGKNGLLGESSLYQQGTYISSAVTAAPTTVIVIPPSDFKRAIIENKTYTRQVFEMMSLKLRLLSIHSLQLSFGTSFQRLCDALIHLALTYGDKVGPDKIKITITFTHQEFADLIGTTRVTVVNHLKKLMTQDLITKDDRHYIINNMAELMAQLAE